jgi:DNA-binding transcriptional ArsR family regulator
LRSVRTLRAGAWKYHARSHTIVGIAEDVDTLLHALADPTRRRVVELLGSGPRRAGELADGVGMAATTMTRHLRTLRDAGLVDVVPVEDDARGRVYSLRQDRIVALQAWVDQVSAFWSEQLGSFKAHAERATRSGT